MSKNFKKSSKFIISPDQVAYRSPKIWTRFFEFFKVILRLRLYESGQYIGRIITPLRSVIILRQKTILVPRIVFCQTARIFGILKFLKNIVFPVDRCIFSPGTTQHRVHISCTFRHFSTPQPIIFPTPNQHFLHRPIPVTDLHRHYHP